MKNIEDLVLRQHHVAFFVGNLEESIAFYEELFGFRLCFTGHVEAANEDVAMLKLKDMVLELLSVPGLTTEQLRRNCLNTNTHVSFMVTDVAEAKARLEDDPRVTFEEADIRVVPNIGPMDLLVTFFRGPNGERIELLQDKNGFNFE